MKLRNKILTLTFAGLTGFASPSFESVPKFQRFPMPKEYFSYIEELQSEVKKYDLEYIVNNRPVSFLTRDDLRELIEKEMRGFHLPSYLNSDFFMKVIEAESSRNIYALSPKGAMGLGQIMESTWNQFSNKPVDYAFNPEENIRTSIKYYDYLINYASKRHSNWNNLHSFKKQKIVAALYNRGLGNFSQKDNWNIQNSPKETRDYVGRVVSGSST